MVFRVGATGYTIALDKLDADAERPWGLPLLGGGGGGGGGRVSISPGGGSDGPGSDISRTKL